LREISGEKQGV